MEASPSSQQCTIRHFAAHLPIERRTRYAGQRRMRPVFLITNLPRRTELFDLAQRSKQIAVQHLASERLIEALNSGILVVFPR